MRNARSSDTPDRNDKVVLREPGFRFPGQRPPEPVDIPRGEAKTLDLEKDEKPSASARNYRSMSYADLYSGRRRGERYWDEEDDEGEYDRLNSRKYSGAREDDHHRQDRHGQNSRDYSEDRRRRDYQNSGAYFHPESVSNWNIQGSDAAPPSLENQDRENRDSEGQRHRKDEHDENSRVQSKKAHIFCHECNLHLGCVAFPDRPEYGREFRKSAEYYCTECAEETQRLNGGGDYSRRGQDCEASRRRQEDYRRHQNGQDSARSGQSSRLRSSDCRESERRRQDHCDDYERHRHQYGQDSARNHQSSRCRSSDRRDSERRRQDHWDDSERHRHYNGQDSARSGHSSQHRSSDRYDSERRRQDNWDDSEGHGHQNGQDSAQSYQSNRRRSPDCLDNFRNNSGGNGDNFRENRWNSEKESGREVIFPEVLEQIKGILWKDAPLCETKDQLCHLMLNPAIHEACLRLDTVPHPECRWETRLDQVIEFKRQHPGREKCFEVWRNTLQQIRFGKKEDKKAKHPSRSVMFIERMIRASLD